jgi:AraC-like DNA-binding protein
VTALARLRKDQVKVVASELGYKQVSHFSRDFTAYFGLRPRKCVRKRLCWSDAGAGARS